MSNTLDFEKICSADETNLRKAEILLYGQSSVINKAELIHFNEFKNANIKIILQPNKMYTIKINGLSQTFYPLLITFWGKIYDNIIGCGPTNKFKMISSLRNNSSNPTSFIFGNDNTMTMQIENITINNSFGIPSRTCSIDSLLAKIIIIYNPCQ
jgi:hypothetical protein